MRYLKGLRYLAAKGILKLQIAAITDSRVAKATWIGSGSHVVACDIGRATIIGNHCTLVHVQIGSFCSLATGCVIGGARHPTEWVSTSPVFHEGRNALGMHLSRHPFSPFETTVIGNDVWIGSNSLIKAGVHIGDGAVIGMGSVVTRDVGPYEIWAGNPARLIRRRFREDISEKLEATRWWDLNDFTLSEFAPTFTDIDAFLGVMGCEPGGNVPLEDSD